MCLELIPVPLNVQYSTGTKSQITLADLRELVSETEGWSDATVVRVSVDKGYNQLDPGGTSISVAKSPRLENKR